MTKPKKKSAQPVSTPERKGKKPSPAADRALAEAEARRAGQADKKAAKEIGGRGGLDPARYGDWEVKGIASDF